MKPLPEQQISTPVHRRIFWCDSKVVVFWTEARKSSQFVAVCIGEIIEDSQTNEKLGMSVKHNIKTTTETKQYPI